MITVIYTLTCTMKFVFGFYSNKQTNKQNQIRITGINHEIYEETHANIFVGTDKSNDFDQFAK